MSIAVQKDAGPVLRGPLDFPDSPLSRAARQPLMLGLFLNLQDIRLSTFPSSSTWTYDYNAEIVRKATNWDSRLRSAARNGCPRVDMTERRRSTVSWRSARWRAAPGTFS